MPGVEPGQLFTAEFELNGQRFYGLNAGPQFQFNEAISLWVNCENQEEVDYFWDALTADGGEESQCGWLKDKFGLSWQIIPRQLSELMADPRAQGRRVQMQVMLGSSRKIVIAAAQKARRSRSRFVAGDLEVDAERVVRAPWRRALRTVVLEGTRLVVDYRMPARADHPPPRYVAAVVRHHHADGPRSAADPIAAATSP